MDLIYDHRHRRLVVFGDRPDPQFWDRVWTNNPLKFDRLVVPTTQRYLPAGAKILEGGCGDGRFVRSLCQAGFKAVGIDTAKKTIITARRKLPGLPIEVGNVLKTRFLNNELDGYWSLGVIEHFRSGFGPLVSEMRRIVRPGGYIFLTFPHLSPLRKLKIWLKLYPEKADFKSQFYQYIFDDRAVAAAFANHGFKLVAHRPFDGYRGLKDEVVFLQPLFRLINKWLPAKLAISFLALPLASHAVLLVLRKERLK